jgi:hypothetical protein
MRGNPDELSTAKTQRTPRRGSLTKRYFSAIPGALDEVYRR